MVWPTRRTAMHVHCEKTSLYTTFWLTRMCSHENDLIAARVCIQLVAQFPMLCSTDMFPRSVSTKRRIHALVHTLKDGWRCVCLQRVTKFLTFYLVHHVSTYCVDYVTCLCACSRTKKTYLHTFRIRKTCTCVTFNTSHPVCHIISHRCTWNEIQPHDL